MAAMPRKPATPPRPTDAELNILRVLWKLGASTVRQVQAALGGEETTGYTTVLKFLQIMTEKGLVERDESSRTHVYRPKLSEQHTQRQLLRDLLGRAFGGSVGKLVVQALSAERSSTEELREIRRLIAQMEKEKGTEKP